MSDENVQTVFNQNEENAYRLMIQMSRNDTDAKGKDLMYFFNLFQQCMKASTSDCSNQGVLKEG